MPNLSVSLSHCAFVLKVFSLHFLRVSVVHCIALDFAFSAGYSRVSAATTRHRRRGGHTATNRGSCVISAASAKPAATQKCQISGFSRTSRLPFQRQIFTNCS